MTLRELRQSSNKTVAEVARELNVQARTVSRYESGERRISLEQVKKLAELYDSSAEEIIDAQLNSCR